MYFHGYYSAYVLTNSDSVIVSAERTLSQAIVFADSCDSDSLNRLEKAISSAIDSFALTQKLRREETINDGMEGAVRLLTDSMGLEERAESLNAFRLKMISI